REGYPARSESRGRTGLTARTVRVEQVHRLTTRSQTICSHNRRGPVVPPEPMVVAGAAVVEVAVAIRDRQTSMVPVVAAGVQADLPPCKAAVPVWRAVAA